MGLAVMFVVTACEPLDHRAPFLVAISTLSATINVFCGRVRARLKMAGDEGLVEFMVLARDMRASITRNRSSNVINVSSNGLFDSVGEVMGRDAAVVA